MLEIIPSNEVDKKLIALYLENRRDMDYEERKMFLDFIARLIKPVIAMDMRIGDTLKIHPPPRFASSKTEEAQGNQVGA